MPMEHGRTPAVDFPSTHQFQLHWTQDSFFSHQDFPSTMSLPHGPPSFSVKSLFIWCNLPLSYRQSWGSVFCALRALSTDFSLLISGVFIFLGEKLIFFMTLKRFCFFVGLQGVRFYYDLCQTKCSAIISLPRFLHIPSLPVLLHPMASSTFVTHVTFGTPHPYLSTSCSPL